MFQIEAMVISFFPQKWWSRLVTELQTLDLLILSKLKKADVGIWLLQQTGITKRLMGKEENKLENITVSLSLQSTSGT